MHRRRYDYGHEVLARAALVLSLVFFIAMALSWMGRSLPSGIDVDPQTHMGTAIPAPASR
jgi:hypothetical protein